MVAQGTTSEYLLTQKTAEEYRGKGYEVLIQAPIDFLPGFTADLLVRKGDEVKVIAVKSRPSLAADPKIGELARSIEAKPGWTFELLLVSEPEKLDSPEGAHSFASEDVVHRIEEAEKALLSGLPEAAFLEWVTATSLRPILAGLGDADRASFLSRYRERLRRAYPSRPDDPTLYPFSRLFFVAVRG